MPLPMLFDPNPATVAHATPARLRRMLAACLLVATALLLTLPVQAAPRVAADIAPVHSLVAQVMQGVGEPRLVIQRGASPHNYALRPSEAAALERAEVVFWTSAQLTPWLDRALGNLAADAERVELVETAGTTRHAFRESVTIDTAADANHDHDHDHDHGHDPGHDHAHDHEGVDPHAWLDPLNARHWLGVIATTLAEVDPANAALYRDNAAAGQARMDALMADIEEAITPVQERAFIVFHDAYQYYERRFGMRAVGAISLSDATDPSPARIAAIRELVQAHSVRCVFAEPQFNPSLVDTVLDGTRAETGVLDPLGSEIAEGPDFYPRLMQALTASLVDCLENGR